MKIANGKNLPLNVQSGGVPNMSGALNNWYQQMTFSRVVKKTIGYQVVESMIEVSFQGVIQPFGKQDLMMKPIGQRGPEWKWNWIHSNIALGLENDDVIKYLGVQYRVLGESPYNLYGYYSYEALEDYTGSGPNVVES